MRIVEWTDENGFERAALAPKSMDDETAKSKGVPAGPPDITTGIDWDAVVRNLQNDLFRNRLFTWEDVKRSQNGLTNAIIRSVKPELIRIYRGLGGNEK